MNILIVNMYYFPNMLGGCEQSVKLLAENLVKAGYTVGVLTMDGSDMSKEEIFVEEINGVHVFRAYSASIYKRRILQDKSSKIDKLKNGINSIINIKMNLAIKKVIAKFNPDIIHTNNLVSMSCWIWKYAARKKIPVVHTLRDYWLLDPTTNINESNFFVSLLFRIYHKRISNVLQGVVTAPSNKTLEIFSQYGYFKKQKKICVVNSIDFDWEKLQKCKTNKKSRISEEIVYIYAGNFSDNKGIKLLLHSFKELNLPNAKLVICGSGPLEEWIKKEIVNEEKIELKGQLNQEELFKEFELADVIIVPSLWDEPFGRVVIEAAQFALPTIASNRGGLPEIIHKIHYGECFDCADGESLVNAIKKFSNRKYLNSILENDPRDIEFYKIDNQISCFSEIYNELV